MHLLMGMVSLGDMLLLWQLLLLLLQLLWLVLLEGHILVTLTPRSCSTHELILLRVEVVLCTSGLWLTDTRSYDNNQHKKKLAHSPGLFMGIVYNMTLWEPATPRAFNGISMHVGSKLGLGGTQIPCIC